MDEKLKWILDRADGAINLNNLHEDDYAGAYWVALCDIRDYVEDVLTKND